MKLGENALITLPSCITSSMKCDKFTLMNENMEKLLELRELNVRLSMVSNVLSSHYDSTVLSKLCLATIPLKYSFLIVKSRYGRYHDEILAFSKQN